MLAKMRLISCLYMYLEHLLVVCPIENSYLTHFDILQELLSFQHPHIQNPRLQIQNPESQVQRIFDTPYDELVAAHLR